MNAPQAKHHGRPEDRIAHDANDCLDPLFCHGRNQYTLDGSVRAMLAARSMSSAKPRSTSSRSGDPDQHSPDFGLMLDVGRHDLENDGIADRVGGRARLPSRASHLLVQEWDAHSGQELLCRPLGKRIPRQGRRFSDGGWWSGARECLGKLRQCRDGDHCSFGVP